MGTMKKRKITLDDLAIMTQNSFTELGVEMNTRFDQVDRRFEVIDERFEEIDRRFDRVENLLLRSHDNRLDALEDTVRTIKTKLKM
jgi:hypothetical protein